ncbi:MAG: hypothetical protein ACRDWI_11665 [Jiangellaceae bacterium]
MNHRRRWLVLSGVVVTLVISGCGGGADEPEGLGTDTPSSASDTSPPASPGEPATEAPDLPPGLVLDEVPELTGTEQAALNVYLAFEAEYWRSLLDSEVSPALPQFAARDVVQIVADQVAVQRDEDFHLGGTLRIQPTVEGATENVGVVAACLDQSQVTTVRDDREEVAPETSENPTFSAIADLSNSGAGWQVSAYRLEFDPC